MMHFTRFAFLRLNSFRYPLFLFLFLNMASVLAAQSITLISPNGGQIFCSSAASSATITWSHAVTSGIFKIEYSTDGGITWITINASFTGGASPSSYVWAPVPALSSSSCLVRVSDVSNPAVNDVSNSTFSIFPSPSLNLGSNQVVCSFPATITGSPTGGAPPYTYNWACFTPPQTTPMVSVTGPGNVCLIVTDGNGCTASDTVNFALDPNLPLNAAISPPGPLGFCPGGSVNLCASASGGVVTYSWSNGSTAQCQTFNAPGTYWVNITDNYGCTDMAAVSVLAYTSPSPTISLSPAGPLCADDTFQLTVAPAFASYAWSQGGSAQTISVTYPGNANVITETVTVTDTNGCTGSASVTVTFLDDCVFPGDANYDLIADNNDILEIGWAIGANGTPRAGASLAWAGQVSADWGSTLPSGADTKQADCDGDATVSLNDTLAVTQNYGLIHLKTSQSGGNIGMHLIPASQNLVPGDVLQVQVELGDAANRALLFQGLAFSFEFDTALFDHTSLSIAYPSATVLGTRFTNYLSFAHSPSPGRIDFAIAKTDGTHPDFYGGLLTISLPVLAAASYPPGGVPATIAVNRTRLMDGTGNLETVQYDNDTLHVFESPQQRDLETIKSIRLFPNPAKGTFCIQSDDRMNSVEVCDMQGKQVLTRSLSGETFVNQSLAELAPGWYFVRVQFQNGGASLQKLEVTR